MKTTQQELDKQDYAKKVASILRAHADDAAGEMGYAEAYQEQYDPGIKRKVARLKKRGVTDISGRIADDYYNDPNFLADMIVDHFPACNAEMKELIFKELDAHGHAAMKKAVKLLRKTFQLNET